MLTHGQIISLEQIQQGARDANISITISGERMNIGQLMDLWLWQPPGQPPIKLECFIAGFQILAGDQIRPLPAVQVGDSPLYAIVEFGAGTLCQPGQLTPEQALEVQAVYHQGFADGYEPLAKHNLSSTPTPGGRKNHLSVAVDNSRSPGERDG